MKNFLPLLAVILASVFVVPAHAEDAPKNMPDAAAMQKMMEASTPGENHKILEPLVGTWDYTVTFRMAPDAPEETSTGSSENKWVLDGRFVQQNVSGTMEMNGQTMNFQGIGYLGYDNVKGEYNSLWMDNMSTTMMISGGKYDAATKSIKESGQFFCPMRGKEVQFDSELQFVDADHFTYTMYDTTDGQRFKGMEIKYTRRK